MKRIESQTLFCLGLAFSLYWQITARNKTQVKQQTEGFYTLLSIDGFHNKQILYRFLNIIEIAHQAKNHNF
jgi:hypothetical protein